MLTFNPTPRWRLFKLIPDLFALSLSGFLVVEAKNLLMDVCMLGLLLLDLDFPTANRACIFSNTCRRMSRREHRCQKHSVEFDQLFFSKTKQMARYGEAVAPE